MDTLIFIIWISHFFKCCTFYTIQTDCDYNRMICEKKKVFLFYQMYKIKKAIILFSFFFFLAPSSPPSSLLLTHFQFFFVSLSFYVIFFYIFNTSSYSRFIFIRIFDGLNFRYFVWKIKWRAEKKSEQIEERWVSMGWVVGSMNQFYDVHFRQVGRKTHTVYTQHRHF